MLKIQNVNTKIFFFLYFFEERNSYVAYNATNILRQFFTSDITNNFYSSLFNDFFSKHLTKL